jgi:hypothetical protein
MCRSVKGEESGWKREWVGLGLGEVRTCGILAPGNLEEVLDVCDF